MAKKTARKSAKSAKSARKAAPRRAAVKPRPKAVTLEQAERILSAKGFARAVSVVRDRLDANKIREILVRE